MAKQATNSMKERCLVFLKAAIEEVKSRLPRTRNVFSNLNKFRPEFVLSQTSQIPFPHLREKNTSAMEDQY